MHVAIPGKAECDFSSLSLAVSDTSQTTHLFPELSLSRGVPIPGSTPQVSSLLDPILVGAGLTLQLGTGVAACSDWTDVSVAVGADLKRERPWLSAGQTSLLSGQAGSASALFLHVILPCPGHYYFLRESFIGAGGLGNAQVPSATVA